MKGYYDVMIVKDGCENRYRVFADSDYAAAVMVRKTTGFMATSERDVIFVAPNTGHGLYRFSALRA